MDNKTLSDFMPKVSSEGEITYGKIVITVSDINK